jgi:glycosyltransferase involved in cell wall biosynthesis
MIVKNEARVIERCLASVKPHVDGYAIVDTGSTDGTRGAILEVMGDLPGNISNVPWTDFATARNQSLALARRPGFGLDGYDYAFVIDADEELVQLDPEKPFGPFTADSYAMRLRLADSENAWARRQIFNLHKPWSYEDPIHERSVCDVDVNNDSLLGWEIVSHNDGGRSQEGIATKAKRDLRILRRLMRKHPDEPRYVYYAGQSAMMAGRIREAIKFFRKRIAMGEGLGEEKYVCAFNIAALMEQRGDDWRDVCEAYRAAFNMRPTRAEPLWALAVLHNDRREFGIAEVYARGACGKPRPVDVLIVNESIYKWRCAHELTGALSGLGKLEEAKGILENLAKHPFLPEAERPQVLENLEMVRAALGDQEA